MLKYIFGDVQIQPSIHYFVYCTGKWSVYHFKYSQFWKYMSLAYKLGYGIHIAVHAWLIERNRLGMLADAQAIQCDSTTHVQRFFSPK